MVKNLMVKEYLNWCNGCTLVDGRWLKAEKNGGI